jgi:phosphatidylinositol alpha-1,6-mannosyltransferase
MAEVLFVSKPVSPPWNDSSKNLARDIACHLRQNTPVMLERRKPPVTSFSPSLRENWGALRHLLRDRDAKLWHFFFAPNWKSAVAARVAAGLRRVPTVHTVCSLPREEAPLDRLVFADVTVVLSRFAHDRFRSAGVRDASLRLIPPSLPPLRAPNDEERLVLRRKHGIPESAMVWIYPGDLEHGGGAEVALEALAASGRADSVLLMACRDKTKSSGPARARLVDQARHWGLERRVRWLGETPEIHEMLALSDFTLLPSRSPYAKMDYPLVALEAMCMGRPTLVGSATPAAELAQEGAAVAVEPNGRALAAAIEKLCADVDSRGALCGRARELVLERFAPRKVAADYERLYADLLAE